MTKGRAEALQLLLRMITIVTQKVIVPHKMCDIDELFAVSRDFFATELHRTLAGAETCSFWRTKMHFLRTWDFSRTSGGLPPLSSAAGRSLMRGGEQVTV